MLYVGLFFITLLLAMLLFSKKRVLEFVSVYWFRLALSVFVLFLFNVGSAFIGFFIPINAFNIAVITILGLPGMLAVIALSIIL